MHVGEQALDALKSLGRENALGDYSSLEEGIRRQNFGSLSGSYQHHGVGSGLVFFDDIGTKM